MAERYLVALGSNRRHHRLGCPEAVLRAAFAALDGKGLKLKAVSAVVASRPLGPSLRRYANAAAVVKSKLAPDELLDRLKAIEQRFGRRIGGRRWGARVLDLDIVLWSGGAWSSPPLTIPHPAFRTRRFVLGPAAAIAPRWRDPLTALTVRHLLARLTRPRPLPIGT
ncbi:2-amino-4-hydroxy-6-hydroxymethyldihydropteridine diphosphokinase [Novosphingobium sp. G106]|uniref:2-amino-4-hydroxy-6- hydroxymethyldihydropteridine diphosphokinase n=1 Tax=Novosphingobium sp. G106 TaxID=2849500 RepID=UPI001C2D3ED1|nr:2-amino-4-hydroxy-6-hydroxymethyldihydropteridine diphosphokinase [Novosphingobium sp. G106]MBV1691018.1 2-amino-4-hydroxy-6-hydroxymethyldihydropteridine diphosphokinase [Novosphingobium sp. G106]